MADEVAIPVGSDDLLAPKLRETSETLHSDACVMVGVLNDIGEDKKTLAEAKGDDMTLAEFVALVVGTKKPILANIGFIKRIKNIASKQFGATATKAPSEA